MEERRLWFKRKIWGWYPCSWEGWLVLLILAGIFTFLVTRVEEDLLNSFIFIFIITVILIVICYMKGEKPRWSWSR